MSNRTAKDRTTNMVSVKLKPEVREALHNLSDFRKRSSHFLMNEAISHYVEMETARMNFIKAGESAAKHYEETGEHITFEEFDKWVDSLPEDVNSKIIPCHK
ncbi:MAG: hypothetical protein R3D71_08550 [Rickettsiales bacterium]